MENPLRAYRRARKLTLADLAPKFGLTISQLSRIERNEPTSLETALTIRRETGVAIGPLANASNRDINAVERVFGGAQS